MWQLFVTSNIVTGTILLFSGYVVGACVRDEREYQRGRHAGYRERVRDEVALWSPESLPAAVRVRQRQRSGPMAWPKYHAVTR